MKEKAVKQRKYTKAAIKKDFQRNWKLYLMIIPAIVCLILFAYETIKNFVSMGKNLS